MRYIDFRQNFKVPLITSQDIRLLAADITPSQLTLWQKQEYITKIRGGVYIFNDSKDHITPWEVSSVVVEPSYISLETVLAKHSLIPEMVFTTTCLTTKNTRISKTYLGTIDYKHIKSELFFGYHSFPGTFRPYLMAYPEKAILDFFYLNPQYNNQGDIEGLRIEPSIFRELDQVKLDQYLAPFPKRVHKLIKIIRGMHD